MKEKQSILFVRPDYHCSFFYRDQFRQLGWKADIYLPHGYPKNLLYSKEDLLKPPQFAVEKLPLLKFLNRFLSLAWWLTKFWRYDYHIYYGGPPAAGGSGRGIGLQRLFGDGFVFELTLAKLCGIKLVYLGTGCRDEETKENFSKLDAGNVCGNCGMFDKCDDNANKLNFSRIVRYFDMGIGTGSIDSTQFSMTHLRYKSIDLDLWHPNLIIPPEHKLPHTLNIRVLHSNYLSNSGRDGKGRNIKGSSFVSAAIDRLKEEGFQVEYLFIHDVPSNQMRFYQAQADIVVEQLIYGWWGSTFVETSALGKPVVCYLRPAWKKLFLESFPQYSSLPVVEADTKSIYSALKKLVVDTDYRQQKGEESRRFAERHFNPKDNTYEFIKILKEL